jgi:hypothetical protein
VIDKGDRPEAIMNNAMRTVLYSVCLAWMAASQASSQPLEITTVMGAFDSAAGRFHVADIVGTVLAIKRDGGRACGLEVEDAAAEELNAWLERPSTQVTDTSAFVTRRDQVEGIIGALLKLDPSIVCKTAQEELPASLRSILRR